jgi:hypothetical protein
MRLGVRGRNLGVVPLVHHMFLILQKTRYKKRASRPPAKRGNPIVHHGGAGLAVPGTPCSSSAPPFLSFAAFGDMFFSYLPFWGALLALCLGLVLIFC